MGPDPVATGSLSSQLAEMSKCSVGGSGRGTLHSMGTPAALGVPSHYTVGAGVPTAECQPPLLLGPLLNLAAQLGQIMGDSPSQPHSC